VTQHLLHGLRGSAYVAEYKRLYAELSPAIKVEFDRIVAENGKFTLRSLGALANKFCVPLTFLDDCLPEITGGVYPSGAWERRQKRGAKARDVGVMWD